MNTRPAGECIRFCNYNLSFCYITSAINVEYKQTYSRDGKYILALTYYAKIKVCFIHSVFYCLFSTNFK